MRAAEMFSIGGLLAVSAFVLSPQFSRAQERGQRVGPPGGADGAISRLMVFDKNHDGKLIRSEVTDPRLQPLFDRADANHDGAVTKAELTAELSRQPMFAGRGGPGGFGDPARPDGFGGPGGPGGPGFGPPPRPGQILPGFIQERLGLSARQKEELAKLQSDVDKKLDGILTAEQRKQLASQPRRGPGGPGFGGPGGPGGPGFGGPGGPGGPGFGGPPGQAFGR